MHFVEAQRAPLFTSVEYASAKSYWPTANCEPDRVYKCIIQDTGGSQKQVRNEIAMNTNCNDQPDAPIVSTIYKEII